MMKTRFLAVCVVSLAMLLAPTQVANAQSQEQACANASISIRTGTATVSPGTTIGIAGVVQNCSSRKARYTVVVSATSSCGLQADIASIEMALAPGHNRIYGVSYPMPVNTCFGSWTATVEVRDHRDKGGTLTGELNDALANASTTITIQ